MAKYSEDQDRLLDQSSDSDDFFSNHDRQPRQTSRWDRAKTILQIATFILLLYVAILLTINVFSGTESAVNCAPSPWNEPFTLPQKALEFEQRTEWPPAPHPWGEPPSEEVDLAWKELLYAQNIRVTSEELDLLNENKTARVHVTGNDGKDYAAVMGVYHHMHCLNSIWRLMHWDYYGPKDPEAKQLEDFEIMKKHASHCHDTIRQALMCHANTGIYTSEWDPRTQMPSIHLKSEPITTCVKWDSLSTWANKRALRPGQFKYLDPSSQGH